MANGEFLPSSSSFIPPLGSDKPDYVPNGDAGASNKRAFFDCLSEGFN